jgi:hypothetical protein
MRTRWLVVIVIASLCLNLAVVGTYVLHRVRRDRPRRFPVRRLTAETREKLRQTREAAMPGFLASAERVQSTDSLLWAEMRREYPDSARVESLCQELGRIHGAMRAMVFRQMHRELQLMPDDARDQYLKRMMRMRPGLGAPRRHTGRHVRRNVGPPEGEPEPMPVEPPPESGE